MSASSIHPSSQGKLCRTSSTIAKRKLKEETLDMSSSKNAKKVIPLNPPLFKNGYLSKGGMIKDKGEVLKFQASSCSRPPNMTCRIESFGRICQKFDLRRKRWVEQMGFGGLLHFVSNIQLPRQLAYWIMTRIDPINKCMIASDGRLFWFSKKQVRWVLGIPQGMKEVPNSKILSDEARGRVKQILLTYGETLNSKPNRDCEKDFTMLGIPVTSRMLDRLEGEFYEKDEEEFKGLFLIVALHMVLCPTQSPRLSAELVPALSCITECSEYDWCQLVLNKLMDSVLSFARRFYANGYAGGCGGCAIFAIIFYLDRLNMDPISWDAFPRIKVWSMKQIRMTAKLDRLSSGDYGNLGYGERHPRHARDIEAPTGIILHNDLGQLIVKSRDRRRCSIGANRE